MLEADSFLFPHRFALEFIAEKGHPFAEELRKVSSSVGPHAGIFVRVAGWPSLHLPSDHLFLSVPPGASHSFSGSLSFSTCQMGTHIILPPRRGVRQHPGGRGECEVQWT